MYLLSNGFILFKIYNKRNDLDFDIVSFSVLDGDVPVLPFMGLYFSTSSIR